ncbi:Signal transduction histidine kinase [Austwickia chelonae]|uniref:histidine kinase n=1 Tax=Austwickia chelonae NBRC 105200 TaxID=1184607 RepID=K6UN45_9MICO|nr:histidine kinase [Austwickia chelonae]GAB78676.1 putative two-component histidine kinase [Austwickia chelonae NBRC 105200]SEW34621.1 Signal transduction histidine kinase [Austwickia chelonae]
MTRHDLSAWLTRHPMAGDACWMALYAPVVLLGTLSELGGPSRERWWVPFWCALILVPMLWRRRFPELLAMGAILAHLVQMAVMNGPSILNLLILTCVYSLAAYSKSPHYRWWLLAAMPVIAAETYDWAFHHEYQGDHSEMSDLKIWLITALTVMAVVGTFWVMGELSRHRMENIQALRERAEYLERERDQRARLAAQDERARIAREMHDVVAHSLSVIVVQADGGTYAASHGSAPEKQTEVAVSALRTIAETAREALSETRRLVGVLRRDDDETEYTPQATLAQVEELVERLRSAGISTTYLIEGDPESHPPLSAGAEMAAYRVIQEALTNAMKHGGPEIEVAVTVSHQERGVMLTVRDNGLGSQSGADTDGQGHGLIGMTERITSYGGKILARDRLSGGFEVVATIPTDGRTRT